MNEKEKKIMHRVKCPVCGYKMPIYYDNRAISQGVTVTCKGRNCHAVFELKIENGIQIR